MVYYILNSRNAERLTKSKLFMRNIYLLSFFLILADIKAKPLKDGDAKLKGLNHICERQPVAGASSLAP